MCYATQTYWYRYRNLVSTPLKIVGIVSVSYRFEKAGIAHPYFADSCPRLTNIVLENN